MTDNMKNARIERALRREVRRIAWHLYVCRLYLRCRRLWLWVQWLYLKRWLYRGLGW